MITGRQHAPSDVVHADVVHAAAVDVLKRAEIAGWVEVDRGAPPIRVGLFLNDVEATGTFATPVPADSPGTSEIRRFRFAMSHFWRYATTADRVTVRAGGRPMQLTTKGLSYRPRKDGSLSVAELRQRLGEGYTFSQSGKFQLSKTIDREWQQQVFRLYEAVGEVMRQTIGTSPFLCYGTLLGAIREHGFIGHDRDFDCGYLSPQETGQAAAAELVRLSLALVDAGFHVIPKYSCIAVADAESGRTHIDIGLLYPGDDGRVAFPFGIAGTTVLTTEQLGEPVEIDFCDHRVLVPSGAEDLLETIYGASWRTPNSGFDWRRDRTLRNREGLLTDDLQDIIYWADFYATTHDHGPSSFATEIATKPDLPDTVIDLGCGDGRDIETLASGGRRVIGVDRSPAGLQQARARALPPEANVAFAACDLQDEAALAEIIDRARSSAEAPVLFYARFLLHSLPTATQRSLLQTLARHGVRGDAIATETRTDKDKTLRKTYSRRVRRFTTAATMVEAIEQSGFSVVARDEGTGFAPYDAEDPELLRLVAVRKRLAP